MTDRKERTEHCLSIKCSLTQQLNVEWAEKMGREKYVRRLRAEVKERAAERKRAFISAASRSKQASALTSLHKV